MTWHIVYNVVYVSIVNISNNIWYVMIRVVYNINKEIRTNI